MKKLIFIITIILTYSLNSFAENPHFIDYVKILNTSKPGADVQKKLQNKFKSESKKFAKLETDIRKEEAEIISQKKVLSKEEYTKKVEALRKKVTDLQKDKQKSSQNISMTRNKARQDLLKAVNPIIKKYMEDNKIRIIINKQSVVMGDTTLEITDKIIAILNKELQPIKIN